nr:peroxidase 51-like [Tanacetum cinerariifolium]
MPLLQRPNYNIKASQQLFGCSSMIVSSSGSNTAEKDHRDNLSLAKDGFDMVNEAKAAVDAVPRCSKSLHNSSYSEYEPKTLRLTFEDGVQMLKEAGVDVDPLGDLNTESE